MELDEVILFLPGDCFRIRHPEGFRVAQIKRVQQDGSLTVALFQHDPRQRVNTALNYHLPVALISAEEEATMARPSSLASLVFVCHANRIENLTYHYVYGMQNVFCIKDPSVILAVPSLQSLTHIISDGVHRVSCELQRVLSNRRQNQSTCSVSKIPFSTLTWKYLVDFLGIPPISKDRPSQATVLRSKDLSITQVKRKIRAHILRIEDINSLQRFISIFGVSSVVGVRKRLPSLAQRLQPNNNDEVITGRVAIKLLDVINVVDVESNEELGPRSPNAGFSFHGNGYKGIDLIYMPELSSLRISIRYKCFIVQDALLKLNALGISTSPPQQQQHRLTDEEIELLL